MKSKNENCHFDSEKHIYTIKGIQVPSVTQILGKNPSFDKVDPVILEEARQDGLKMHYEAEMLFKYQKVIGDFSKLVDGFLKRKFSKWEIYSFEKPMYSEPLGFAGTADLILRYKTQYAIVDWKRSYYGSDLRFALQMAGYKILIQRPGTCTNFWILTYKDRKEKNVYTARAEGYFRALLQAEKIRKKMVE